MAIIKRIIAFLFSLLFIFILLFATHGHSNCINSIKYVDDQIIYTIGFILKDDDINNTVVSGSEIKDFFSKDKKY